MSADTSSDVYASLFAKIKELSEDKSGGEDAANRKRNASETRNLRSYIGKTRKMEEQLSTTDKYAIQTGTKPGPEPSDGNASETGANSKRRAKKVVEKPSELGLSFGVELPKSSVSKTSTGKSLKRKTGKAKKKSSEPGISSEPEPSGRITRESSSGNDSKRKTRKVKEKLTSPGVLSEPEPSGINAGESVRRKDQKEISLSPEVIFETKRSVIKTSDKDNSERDNSNDSEEKTKEGEEKSSEPEPTSELEESKSYASEAGSEEGYKSKQSYDKFDSPELTPEDGVTNENDWALHYEPRSIPSPVSWSGDGFFFDLPNPSVPPNVEEQSLEPWSAVRHFSEAGTDKSKRSLEECSSASGSYEKNPSETRNVEEHSHESRPSDGNFSRKGPHRSYERRTRVAEEISSEPGPSGRCISETVTHNAPQGERAVERQSSGPRPSSEPGPSSGAEPSPEQGPSSRPGRSSESGSRPAFGPEPTLQDLIEDTKEVLLGANHDLNRMKEMLMQQIARREQDEQMVGDLMELKELMKNESCKALRRARKLRFRDILIFGSDIRGSNVITLEMAVERFLQEKMNLTVSISNAEIVGQPGSPLSFVIARLENAQDRFAIFENLNLLPRHITIRDNLSQKEREEQKEITEFVKAERAKGHDVQEGCGKVFINNKWRHWDKIKKRTSENDPSEQEEEEREQPPAHPYTEKLLNIKARLVHSLFQGITDATPSTSGT